jgi:hypothetical protein
VHVILTSLARWGSHYPLLNTKYKTWLNFIAQLPGKYEVEAIALLSLPCCPMI